MCQKIGRKMKQDSSSKKKYPGAVGIKFFWFLIRESAPENQVEIRRKSVYNHSQEFWKPWLKVHTEVRMVKLSYHSKNECTFLTWTLNYSQVLCTISCLISTLWLIFICFISGEWRFLRLNFALPREASLMWVISFYFPLSCQEHFPLFYSKISCASFNVTFLFC